VHNRDNGTINAAGLRLTRKLHHFVPEYVASSVFTKLASRFKHDDFVLEFNTHTPDGLGVQSFRDLGEEVVYGHAVVESPYRMASHSWVLIQFDEDFRCIDARCCAPPHG